VPRHGVPDRIVVVVSEDESRRAVGLKTPGAAPMSRTILLCLVVFAVCCGQASVTPLAAPINFQVPGKLKDPPKATTQSDKPPVPATKEITWVHGVVTNAPGYLAPYKGAAQKPDLEKTLGIVRQELAKDTTAHDLLKKLLGVQTLEVQVLENAPGKSRPSRKPKGAADGVLALYFRTGKSILIDGVAFLEFEYSIVSSRSSTLPPLFIDAEIANATRLAFNDLLLRKDLGCVFVTGTPDESDVKEMKSAAELRKETDAQIERHLKTNESVHLKKSK
jgi:hypothetical protein